MVRSAMMQTARNFQMLYEYNTQRDWQKIYQLQAALGMPSSLTA